MATALLSTKTSIRCCLTLTMISTRAVVSAAKAVLPDKKTSQAAKQR